MATFPTTPTVGQQFTVGNIIFTYNGVGWESSQGGSIVNGITFSATAPAFVSVNPGHIWVYSVDPSQQYVYAVNGGGTPIWQRLGKVGAVYGS